MIDKNKSLVYSLVLFLVLAIGLGSVSVAQAIPSESESLSIEDGSNILVIETLENMWENIRETFLELAPGLVFFFALVIIGYVVAKLASWSITKISKKIGLEKAMVRVGVTKQVKKLGLKSVSGLIGILFFWFIFVIFLQVALDYAGIQTLTDILAPIVLFIPRLIVAVIVLVIGLYVAEMVVKYLKNFVRRTPLSKDIMKVDKMTDKAGISLMDIIYIFIKAFILLFFINIALEIIAIPILADFINPVLIVIPLLIAAMAVIVIGLIVTNYVVDFAMKMLKEFEVDRLIEPVESMVEREGITLKVISYVLKLFIMLIFVQIAVGILNREGMFNQLAELVNTVILWIPNLLVAIFIGLIGFWIATWIHGKVVKHGRELDLPFIQFIAKGVQALVIYIAIVMALAQIGIEVPILYLVFGIAVGAVFLGLGVGFAYGSKDVFLNLVGSIQSDQTLKEGDKIEVEGYEGVIKSVGRYSVELETSMGKTVHIPHSKLAGAVIEKSE
ncbi:MAG: mechanosensitive ion channel family protein [Candidatus Natronoplasma sp.]